MSLARPTLEPLFEQAWNRLPEIVRENLERDDERVFRVLVGSSFVVNWVVGHPEEFVTLLGGQWFERDHDANALRRECERAIDATTDPTSLGGALRRVRHRFMARVVWRDLTNHATLEDTTRELSDLADQVLELGLDRLYRWACESLGTPTGDESGEPQRMVVLGLGKLGARELNVSSDVDLMFAYPERGKCRGQAGNMTNQEFFIRLGQSLVRLLGDVTDDGFVFRVDMRLRPFGESGALCLSFPAMESYYEQQGRDWERYALIKARAVAGDVEAGQRLLKALEPFVYRRYLDFSTLDSLRAMKASIERERAGARFERDVKLGPGGIREVEFIAQLFQLIWGGRELELRRRELVPVLRRLETSGHLPPETVEQLAAGYTFLRHVEHRLQALHDHQTHELPSDDLGQARIAYEMGFSDWRSFSEELARHRQRISAHFAAVISTSRAPGDSDAFDALWSGELEEAAAMELLASAGFSDPATALAHLGKIHGARAQDVKQDVGRARLDAFVPRLLRAAAQTDDPQTALTGGLELTEAVLRRTAYLVLLTENPVALGQLVALCAHSRWIPGELARHPVLLDELLDPATLYSVPDRAGLDAELALRLGRVPAHDAERQIDVLCVFKEAHALRVAACEVTGVLPLMRVSDYLTYVAEAILSQVLRLAWAAMVGRHGSPEDAYGVPLVVVAYGKLGGLELGPGSDLDIVFLHDLPSQGETSGPEKITNAQFLNRLVRRIIHFLTAQTLHGCLYEVDTRLRPSGRSGLLVSSLDAFESYQREEAWTFEHQALVRARAVAGDERLIGRFEDIRKHVLSKERDRQQLLEEIVSMRKRISDEKGEPEDDLKVGRGGMVDIEFMVQYIVLAWASRFPSLVRYSDNVRILEAAASEGLISLQDAATLHDAYLALRSEDHRRLVSGDTSRVASHLAEHRQAVREVWQRIMTAAPTQSVES
jgi:glutamate-ammonia-ligase adenylyltransferase